MTSTVQLLRLKYSKSIILLTCSAWAFAIGLTIAAVLALKGPDPVPAIAPPSEFSTERAMDHVRAIAAAPHPIGSTANDAVTRYLLAQLSALGLQPQLFQATGIHNGGRLISIGHIHDVIGRFSGTANSRAIMLVAHYDSAYRAPGAADDGAGVAAILEAVRALRTSSPLKNDVIVLFTDGEEPGLLGAEAFATLHPWLKDVGFIMNFEARGNRGPSLLFETGPDNGAAIDAVAHSDAYPLGSSLFYALYKLLPNDTDYTVFRRLNIPGLNSAFGENMEAYHSQLDTPGTLSASSLQHEGSNALRLTRTFGELDLTNLAQARGDDIFFDWFGTNLIAYKQFWVIPGEVLLSALCLFAVFSAVRQGRARTTMIVFAFLYSFLFLLVPPMMMAAIQWLALRVLAGQIIVSDSGANLFMLVGFVGFGIAVGITLFKLGRKYFALNELALGGLLLACILSCSVALLLPAGSYLLFWPALPVATGFIITQREPTRPLGLNLLGFAGAGITILLFMPLAYLVYIFLTLQLITVVVVGVLLGIAFLICFSFVESAAPQRDRYASVIIILCFAAISLSAGMTMSHHSRYHPRHDTLLYSIDDDARKAAWISYDHTLDIWTAKVFSNQVPVRGSIPSYLGGLSLPVLWASAPTLDLTGPIARVDADELEGGARKMRMHIASPRGAEVISIVFGNDTHPISLTVDGRKVDFESDTDSYRVKLFGMQDRNTDLDFVFQGSQRVTFWLSDQTYGLPVAVGARPEGLIAGDGSDITQVSRKYIF